MREWNKFLHHKEGYLLLNQNKNIKIYSIQKTYKIEWHHKVTSYALFTVYDTKFVNQKLFEPTEDIIKTVMKPFSIDLFIVWCHFYHSSATLSSVNNLTERAIGLVYCFRSLCDITLLFAFFHTVWTTSTCQNIVDVIQTVWKKMQTTEWCHTTT